MTQSGCIQEGNNLTSLAPPPSVSEPTDPPDTAAEGWSQVILLANYAKTTLGTMAHFNTSRNACGKDAYGAIQSSEFWNEMVQNINDSIISPLRTEALCFPNPQELDANGYYKKSMDGTVEIKLADGSKHPIYETRGTDVCTFIQDLAIAKSLLNHLNRLVILADKEDCPNGWGSTLESNHGRF